MAAEPLRRTLEIAINPRDSYGAAIRQQLTTDWLQKARELGIRPEAVIEYEVTRRRIHQHFNVTFREWSGPATIRVANGEYQRLPLSKGSDPRELPGYLPFFDWLANEYHADYYRSLREHENSARWAHWSERKIEAVEAFITAKKRAGYRAFGFYYYYDEFYEDGFLEMPSFSKDGKTYSATELGWKRPEYPKVVPEIKPVLCPLDPEWKLK